MKRFSPLTRQIERWLRKSRLRCFSLSRKVAQTSLALTRVLSSKKKLNSRELKSRRRFHKTHPPLMFALAVISLTSVVGYRFYNHPELAVGTVSPDTFIAPWTASFVDEKTTEEERFKKLNGVFPILKHDAQINQQVTQKIAASLNQIEQLRKLAGSFPFVDVNILSLPSQRYLRQSQEWEWQTILAAVEYDQEVNPAEPGFWLSDTAKRQLNPAIQQATVELQNYRQSVSESEFESLKLKIIQVRQGYIQAQAKLSQVRIAKWDLQEKSLLLDLTDSTWEQTKQAIVEAKNRILTQGISQGVPSNLIENTVRININNIVPEVTEPLATQLLVEVLQPNLIQDTAAMKREAEKAAREVEPVVVNIRQGQVIVKSGEIITQEDFVLLDGFVLSGRRIKWAGIGLSAILVTSATIGLWLVERQIHRPMRRRDHLLLCLLSLSAPVLAIVRVPYTSLPAIGFLVSSFYSPTLAVTQVSLLTGLVGFTQLDTGAFAWDNLIAGAAGGLLAAVMAARLRSREELALLGGAVGLTQGGVYLIVNLIRAAATGTAIWYPVLVPVMICGLSGLAWSVVALGISPYLERLFDLVTPIRLAELSNPNRPLLKRLAIEAPGTFQHTMFVASLAEAAARELHCNVELVRAGTLYHDIGKMHDPLGFIENQMGGPNKHDQINDPWKSSKIIKKHVSEGLVMARKYGLPEAIRDFIPEHQGTLLISYFYFQAQQKNGSEQGKTILESDFRYDGPIPQSRETGITMLADGCEAALRSLKDVSPEAALNMINKIFRARWQENQLADSGLKREELAKIAEVFVRVWQQSNHKRIAYPKAALEPQKQRNQIKF